MKVSGVGSGSSVSGSKRTDKTSSDKGMFRQALVEAMDGVEEPALVEAPSAAGMIEGLFAVQAAGDALDRGTRRRVVQRGEEILDRLEDIRHGLLLGTVPKDKLVSLAQMMRARRETCSDPRLAGLLDEIELRAEVELAKLSR